MQLIELLNSEPYRTKAQSIIIDLSEDEIQQWKTHPLTKWLLLTLKGDYLDYHAGWEEGQFVRDSAEGTAQLNAKQLGALEVITRIASDIERLNTTIKELQEEDVNSDRLQSNS